jgi:hypothetical protein
MSAQCRHSPANLRRWSGGSASISGFDASKTANLASAYMLVPSRDSGKRRSSVSGGLTTSGSGGSSLAFVRRLLFPLSKRIRPVLGWAGVVAAALELSVLLTSPAATLMSLMEA